MDSLSSSSKNTTWLFEAIRTLGIIVNLVIGVLAVLFIYTSFSTFDYDLGPESSQDAQEHAVHIRVSIMAALLGLGIGLLATAGLLGALRKSSKILLIYVALLAAMLTILIVLTGLTFMIRSPNDFMKPEADKLVVNSTIVLYNYVEPSDIKTRILDNIQTTLSCCGVNSPDDWYNYYEHKIPKSCCSEPIESSLPVFKYCAESDFKAGCWKAVSVFAFEHLWVLRLVYYVLISVALLFIVQGVYIMRRVKNGPHRV